MFRFLYILLILVLAGSLDAQEKQIPVVSSNADWTPVRRYFDGWPMVLVPPGCFMMGSDQVYEYTPLDALPVHEICFDMPFWIDEIEVTNAAFTEFLNTPDAVGNQSPEGFEYFDESEEDARIIRQEGRWEALPNYQNHPVVEVSWFAARDFCAWRGTMLLSEPEWEYAARGPSGWRYPWGNDWNPDNEVWAGNRPKVSRTDKAGSRPGGASWVGALDMSGNVLEWTRSAEAAYPYDADDGREALDDSVVFRVARGSSWLTDSPKSQRTTNRPSIFPYFKSPLLGFRCMRPYE